MTRACTHVRWPAAAGFVLACASTPDPEEEGQTDIGGTSAWDDPGGSTSGGPGGSGDFARQIISQSGV